jgi:hypothetical protein
MNIKCYTLYDITRTNINFRKRQTERVDASDRKQRSQQSNLETILQIINMRSQPEDVGDVNAKTVSITDIDNYNFGYLYGSKYHDTTSISIWSFTFNVEHPDVFNNGIDALGNLLNDCDQVPMIVDLDESLKLPNQISISDELRNIYFEIVA